MGAKYETFANRHLQIVNLSGNEAMVKCVYHEDSNASMQFNIETGLWVCFGCGVKGTIKKLEHEFGLRVVEDMADVQDIINRLNEIDGLGEPKESDDLPAIPESILMQYRFPTPYWGKRGFEPATVAQFDLGYDPVHNIATIPFRNVHGELQGVIKRFLDPDVELKYRYPKGFKRSMHMFGSWLVASGSDWTTVVIVEGSLDAIKLWQAGYPALAAYGSSVSKTQIMLLRRLGVRRVVLFFDDDEAGHKAKLRSAGVKVHTSRDRRTKEVYKYAEYDKELDLTREFDVSEVIYEKGMKSDPGDMNTEEICEAVEDAVPVDLDAIRAFLKRNKPKYERFKKKW